MINYEETVKAIKELSLFEIRMLTFELVNLLSDTKKLKQVKESLSIGDIVEYVDNSGIDRGRVEKLHSYIAILSCVDRPDEWMKVRYDLINVDNKNIDNKLFKEEFQVGSNICYICQSGHEHRGMITRLQNTKATILNDSGRTIKLKYESIRPYIE